MSDTTSKYEGQTFLITAAAVVLGAGSAATYLYRGGIVPAGFATDEQIEHHLSIDAIEPIELPSLVVEETDEIEVDPADEVVDPAHKPTGEIDGRGIDEWTLRDLRVLAKVESVDLGGKTAKADVFAAIVAARTVQS